MADDMFCSQPSSTSSSSSGGDSTFWNGEFSPLARHAVAPHVKLRHATGGSPKPDDVKLSHPRMSDTVEFGSKVHDHQHPQAAKHVRMAHLYPRSAELPKTEVLHEAIQISLPTIQQNGRSVIPVLFQGGHRPASADPDLESPRLAASRRRCGGQQMINEHPHQLVVIDNIDPREHAKWAKSLRYLEQHGLLQIKQTTKKPGRVRTTSESQMTRPELSSKANRSAISSKSLFEPHPSTGDCCREMAAGAVLAPRKPVLRPVPFSYRMDNVENHHLPRSARWGRGASANDSLYYIRMVHGSVDGRADVVPAGGNSFSPNSSASGRPREETPSAPSRPPTGRPVDAPEGSAADMDKSRPGTTASLDEVDDQVGEMRRYSSSRRSVMMNRDFQRYSDSNGDADFLVEMLRRSSLGPLDVVTEKSPKPRMLERRVTFSRSNARYSLFKP